MNTDTTYIELAFEGMLGNLYGKQANPIRAGRTSLPHLKRTVAKVFRTLAKASQRNINGDDRHRERIITTRGNAATEITNCASPDELYQTALTYAFLINFHLLGGTPRNSWKDRAGWQSTGDFHLLIKY